MREPRFPPLFSGASITSAALALIFAVGLLIAFSFTEYTLIAIGHEGLGLMAVLYLMLLLVAVLAYRLIAPRVWTFTRRFSARAERPTLPPELVGACLRDMDFKCPVCAYNLRGLDKPLCPECSTPVRLFVYTEKPSNAKWNGLVFAWLAVTMLASAAMSYSYLIFIVSFNRYKGSGVTYPDFRTLYWISMGFSMLVGVLTFLSCVALTIASFIRKTPERRGQFMQRTVVWLAVMNAFAALAVVIQVIANMLMRGLWW